MREHTTNGILYFCRIQDAVFIVFLPLPTLLKHTTSSKLPTPWAVFDIHVFIDPNQQGKEHLVLALGDIDDSQPLLMRVHSECLTGDALFSQRCDCGPQLQKALERIAQEGRGAVLYLRQEGRGIGLVNKIRAYQLQDQGADTVEANEQLGFAADLRQYTICKAMLDHFGVRRLRLMTNNPRKVQAMQDLGFEVVERLEHQVEKNPFNSRYLQTKADKLGHLMDFDS